MRILELASIVNFNELEPYSDPSTKKDACIACVLFSSPTNFPHVLLPNLSRIKQGAVR